MNPAKKSLEATIVYRIRIKQRRRINREIPRHMQGWWADVCPGKQLVVRDATTSDLERCYLNEHASRDPADYYCELFEGEL